MYCSLSISCSGHGGSTEGTMEGAVPHPRLPLRREADSGEDSFGATFYLLDVATGGRLPRQWDTGSHLPRKTADNPRAALAAVWAAALAVVAHAAVWAAAAAVAAHAAAVPDGVDIPHIIKLINETENSSFFPKM